MPHPVGINPCGVLLGRKHFVACFVVTILFFVLSCDIQSSLPEDGVEENVSIYYIVADNNLNYYAWNDLEEIEKGYDPGLGKIYLYLDSAQTATPPHPMVWEIKNPYGTGERQSRIIRVYPEQDSTDKEVMQSVLSYMMSLTEAKRYSLVLWSHGSAWLPPEKSSFLSDKGELEDKSFGQDGESELSLNDLVESLPEGFFSIAIDACFMASVEVAYVLRDKAKYLLFSPTEILPDGFPYEKITHLLQQGTEEGLKVAALNYYNHYNDLTNSDLYRSGSICLVKTEGLNQLAEAVRNVNKNNPGWQQALDISLLQKADRSSQGILHDFKDTFDVARTVELVNDDEYKQTMQAYEATVLVFYATEWFYKTLNLGKASGMNWYLPGRIGELDILYKDMVWYRETYQ